jgi:hypothetical protein
VFFSVDVFSAFSTAGLAFLAAAFLGAAFLAAGFFFTSVSGVASTGFVAALAIAFF